MRVRTGLCLVVLLASLAACTGDDRSTAAGGPDLAATLTAQPAVTAERITWTYTLRNDEAAPIAVFNGAWGDDPPDAGPVSWVVAGPDDTIEVSQRVFAPPPGVGLARDFMQYGTVLQPGATLTGTAMASRPFRVNHPYGSIFEPPLKLPEDPSEVVLCVGIARAADVPSEPVPTPTGASPAPAGPLTYYRHSQSTVDREHLVCAPPLDLP